MQQPNISDQNLDDTVTSKQSRHREHAAPAPSSVERAIEHGVDLTLILENVRRTPTERLQRHQRAVLSILALRQQAR